MIYKVVQYFFIFMLYSVAGWVMETLLYLIRKKEVVKRGFLFGPVCPIYGTGAVICSLVLYGRVNNVFLVFIYGLLLCGAIEYITHFLMEKLFNAMWWDYSCRRFNIKGRVYLNGLIGFGLGVVIIVKVLQPLVFNLIALIDKPSMYIICFILYSILLVDITATISDLKDMTKTLKYVQGFIITKSQSGIDYTDEKIKDIKASVLENEHISNAISYLTAENSILKRIRRKHPDFTLKNYKWLLDIIMDKPIEEKSRKDIKLYGTADSVPNSYKAEK